MATERRKQIDSSGTTVFAKWRKGRTERFGCSKTERALACCVSHPADLRPIQADAVRQSEFGLRHALVALLFVLVCQGAGLLGVLTTDSGNSPWYQSLEQPAFAPPSWVFGPVWTALYLMMGIAAFLVWRQGLERGAVRRALGLFVAQLLLNAAWTPVFFGAHRLGLALGVLLALWVLIVLTLRSFAPLSRVAAWLLTPYLSWVSFAGVLNAAYWWLNR